MQVKLFDTSAKEIGALELNDSVFGCEYNEALIHQVVVAQLANARQGTKSTLTRTEVRGGGRKPWRQKGTGHARQGSIRAPHYTHGGVAFAPKPRDYSYTLNKKLKRLALKSALSLKAAEEAVIVVDGLEMSEIKTKTFKAFLAAVGAEGKSLVVTPEVNKNVVLSARNLPGVQTTIATILSTYDILNADKFVVDKAALSKIEEVYA